MFTKQSKIATKNGPTYTHFNKKKNIQKTISILRIMATKQRNYVL